MNTMKIKTSVLVLYIISFILWLLVIPLGIFDLFASKTMIDLDLVITTYSHESDWRSFTYVSSLQELYKQGNYLLGTVIIIFVFIGPLIKYINVSLRFFQKSMKSNLLLKLLSKAAMVDVFVISLLLMISYQNENLVVNPGLGVYLLTASIVLFIVAEVIDVDREINSEKITQ